MMKEPQLQVSYEEVVVFVQSVKVLFCANIVLGMAILLIRKA